MARQLSISVSTATNLVVVFEYDGANIVSHFETGLGDWAVSSRYGSLTNPADYVKLHCRIGETGEFKFSEISDVEVDSVDILATSATLRDIVTALAPTMFAGGDAANPLPSGAATEDKQDDGITEAQTTNARIGADETGTTLRGRIKTWYDAAIAFFSAITTIIVSGKLNTRAAETDALIGALTSPATGSTNYLLTALGQLIQSNSLVAFNDALTPSPITENSSSDVIPCAGAKIITLQYTFANTTLGLNSIFLEGTIDGSLWTTLDSDTGVGDVTGQLTYNASTSGAVYDSVRVSTTTSLSGTTELTGRLIAVR